MIKALTSTVLALTLLSGCFSTGASGHYSGPSKPKTAYVVSDRELDDYTIHNAITAELQKRGFRVIDSRNHTPASASNALVVHYLDRWNFDLIWLPVMYLSSLNIRIIDGDSSEVIGAFRARFSLQCGILPAKAPSLEAMPLPAFNRSAYDSQSSVGQVILPSSFVQTNSRAVAPTEVASPD